jgi:hypothetical protein
MKAQLETHDGKVTLKVNYDPALCNWDEAIAAGLASFGLRHGQAEVIACSSPRQPGGLDQPASNRVFGAPNARTRARL